MAVWQAPAVAFGLALLVVGYSYVGAKGASENSDSPQPIWWRVAHGAGVVALVAMLLSAGTILIQGTPNYFISTGIATLCFAEAVHFAAGTKSTPSTLRLRWLAFAVAGSLTAVGAASEGGPVGVFAAILSLLYALFWWWAVVKIPVR
jgi:hypothetical protein